ncbi:MAG: type II secretion system protein GspD, partial [Desulfuromonas sp.]|nr:type II secretion system protein GspD [Desulfuromonas sp.]
MVKPTAFRTFIIGLGLLALLAGSTAAFAETPPAKPAKAASSNRVTLDFKDVELTDLIQTVSELTGRNFIYDDTVRGKATIVTPEGMTLDEAYQLFLTVLNLKGFTVVPSGKANKIVPLKSAKEANLPLVTDGQKPTEQFVTRLVRLENLDASTIAETVLKPLASPTSNIMVYSPTNTLIITDSAVSIDRMVQLIRELDVPGSSQAQTVIALKHAGAEETAKLCAEMLGSGSTGRRTRGGSAVLQEEASGSKVFPFPRTNSLVVMATADQLAAIRELIALVDQDLGGERANINVYRLENASAETLAKTLNEIITGIRNEARAAASDQVRPAAAVAAGPVTITADKPTNSLIVNAKPEDYATIKGIIEKLDIKRKQVYVEALIMELSMDATEALGVSLQGAASVNDDGLVFGSSNLNKGPLSFGEISEGTGLLTKAVDGLLAGGFFNPITIDNPNGEGTITVPTLSVLINLSKTDGDVNILSAPRLLTSDNEEAEIIVGNNVPIITSRLTDTGGSNDLAQSVSIERKDVALTLRFTPQVTEGDLVRLNVFQEMTDIVPYSTALAASVGSPGDVGPTFTKRSVRNTILAENGRTVVLGGLIGTTINETETKVPWLGDIPVLGWLFKTRSTQEKKTNLLVFINPTIIRGPEDLARVTGRNRQVADRLMNDKTRSALPDSYFVEGTQKPFTATAPGASAAPAAQPHTQPAVIPPAIPVTVPSPLQPAAQSLPTPVPAPKTAPAPSPGELALPRSTPPVAPPAAPAATLLPAATPAPAAVPKPAATPPPSPTPAVVPKSEPRAVLAPTPAAAVAPVPTTVPSPTRTAPKPAPVPPTAVAPPPPPPAP